MRLFSEIPNQDDELRVPLQSRKFEFTVAKNLDDGEATVGVRYADDKPHSAIPADISSTLEGYFV